MDPRPTERERKRELIQTLSQSRASLLTSRRQLGQQLNPVRRLRSAVGKNPLPVFGLAAGGALLLTLLLRRPRSREKSSSTKRLLLGWALSLTKPAARAWLLNRAKEHFSPPQTAPLPIHRRFTVDPMTPRQGD